MANEVNLEDFISSWMEVDRHIGGLSEERGRILEGRLLTNKVATVLVDKRCTEKRLYCAKCGALSSDAFIDFCSKCGRATTQKGVTILIERLSKLGDQKVL